MISAGSGEADDEDGDTSDHRYLEAGFGHSYRPVHFLVIENIGGLGFGHGRGQGRTLFTDEKFWAEGSYLKPFLQNNLALQTNPVDLGLVNRLSVIQFGSIKSMHGGEETIQSPSTPLYWEPTLFVQFGWNRVKFNTQYGYSIPVAGEPDFHWLWFHIGFGMNYRFGG
jgi:hypothetical protein